MQAQFVPPAPSVLAQLYAEYGRYATTSKSKQPLSFAAYLRKIGFTDPTARFRGGDDGQRRVKRGVELVQVPKRKVAGNVQVVVLLVDFPGREGQRPRQQYDDMLFSRDTFHTGSMRDFYTEVTLGRVDVTGTVSPWLRMPHKYDYYVNAQSGTGSYPRNCQKLAADALAVARAKRFAFPKSLDNFGDGTITALVLVHAGPGAEVMQSTTAQKAAIWSHKADLQAPVVVSQGLSAVNYLTVPENCLVGVCAHELGHLLFQWDDFYDPNYDEDGSEWDGNGIWDLMAGGSWNGGGVTPAHPAGLHKMQHGWVTVKDVATTTNAIVIPPYSKTAGTVVRVRSPKFAPTQCLILENRQRIGFDRALPGDGLLVWRVDTKREQVNAARAAMLLVQADGRHSLERPDDQDEGDAGDPFPGPSKRTELDDAGDTCTSFPGVPCGISLKHISVDAAKNIRLDIVFA